MIECKHPDPHVREKVNSLLPRFEKFSSSADQYRFQRARNELNNLASRSTGTKGHVFVCQALRILKKMQGDTAGYRANNHRLTDHAFVRALERVYGLDTNELKDMALGGIPHDQMVMVGPKIVTVLPRCK